ncbi:transcriptional regulator CynR [Paraburkholderia sp. DGU8]|jgi:LysR family cyn operon transcriptional activator|uniref:transcriptional regulator CynR n=1 Tax=Paraburkholderia sp. DGU8 TaxID=3161997 RepID=UPI003466DBE6
MLLRHIRYFLAVAEHRNFTRAAEALHVSQPTLSQQIMQLEDTLRIQLLDRSGRAIRLTDAGAAYLVYAQRALQDLDAGRRAIHDVQELSRGSLRLAVTPTFTAYLVGPLLEKYNRRYPNITVNLLEMPQDRMEALLNNDALDVGIGFDSTRIPDIECQALFVESLAVVVGKSHQFANRRSGITLREFEKEVLVLLSGEFATRDLIDGYCRQNGVVPRVAMEVNSIGAVMELVRRSTLATLLPAGVTRQNSELRLLQLESALPQRTAALLLRKGGYRSAATRAFVVLALEEAAGEAGSARAGTRPGA